MQSSLTGVSLLMLVIGIVFTVTMVTAQPGSGDGSGDVPLHYTCHGYRWISGFDDRALSNMSQQACLTACHEEMEFCCRSLDFHADSQTCYLSAEWSGTQPLVHSFNYTHCEITNYDCENQCAGNPCRNGATCTDGVHQYTCTCAAGFEGVTCGRDVDECASNPCQNGASCIDEVNQYTCTCDAGFSGVNCEENVDECAINPCQNGGSCTDGVNQYTCTCDAGFNGVNCEHAGRCPAGLAHGDGTAEYSKKQPESDGGIIIVEESGPFSKVYGCLRSCIEFVNCLSIYYNNINQTCVMHSTFQPAWILSEEKGWELYVRAG